LLQINKYIFSNKIYKARIQVGELYIDLCDFCSVIDKNDFQLINKFKNLFNENIKYPSLFGKVKLNNETLIKAELSRLIICVEDKINEYNDYIAKFQNKQNIDNRVPLI
jgi:hypothetical protein